MEVQVSAESVSQNTLPRNAFHPSVLSTLTKQTSLEHRIMGKPGLWLCVCFLPNLIPNKFLSNLTPEKLLMPHKVSSVCFLMYSRNCLSLDSCVRMDFLFPWLFSCDFIRVVGFPQESTTVEQMVAHQQFTGAYEGCASLHCTTCTAAPLIPGLLISSLYSHESLQHTIL